MQTHNGNEITFIALQHPLPDDAQKELRALAGDIALARSRLNKATEAHDDQLVRNATRERDNAITALDMTVLAMRKKIGVEFTRPPFLRWHKPTAAAEACRCQ